MRTYIKDLTKEEIIQRLNAGEVIKDSHNSNSFKMIDGVLCSNNLINVAISVCNPAFYFETPEDFKLEVGKFYKTKNGKKAYVSHILQEELFEYPYYGIIEGCTFICAWTLEGKFYTGISDNDLVAEWSKDDE